jgi:hypothetical protein
LKAGTGKTNFLFPAKFAMCCPNWTNTWTEAQNEFHG